MDDLMRIQAECAKVDLIRAVETLMDYFSDEEIEEMVQDVLYGY